MCMLTFYPARVQPDTDALLNGAEINNDGHGYAIVVPGRNARIIVRHSMDAKHLIQRFANDRALYPEGPALFHSRWGTSGEKGKYNCHPFRVNKDRRTVVAHNGVLPMDMQPLKTDRRCDTRMAAEDIFPWAFGHLSTGDARGALAKAITDRNKLVILTVDPAYSEHAYVINEQAGVWDDGIWYSNYDYCPYVYPVRHTTTVVMPSRKDNWHNLSPWLKTDFCPVCGHQNTIDEVEQVCRMCTYCLDCYEELEACDCFTPPKPIQPTTWRLTDAFEDWWDKGNSA